MQAGAAGIQENFGAVMHDGELHLQLDAGLIEPALPILIRQPAGDCFFNDFLAVGHGMQDGIQGMPFHREGCIHGQKILPCNRAGALKERVKGICWKGGKAQQNAFGAP